MAPELLDETDPPNPPILVMIPVRILAVFLAVATGLAISLPGQEWTDEQLDQQIQGFLKDDLLSRLEQTAELIANESVAARAVATRIHGDHREYLLRIQRLLDQLTDERWLTREDAQRRLIETGAKARAMLEDREQKAELLEERIRTKFILDQINARGTEKEEREIRLLRGLTEASFYMTGTDSLRSALVSALGHTDPVTVGNAIRSLGTHGSDDEATAVFSFSAGHTLHRRGGFACLARMNCAKALDYCRDLLRDENTPISDKIAMLRQLRQRPEAAALLQEVAGSKNSNLALAASLQLGKHPKAKPVSVTLFEAWGPQRFRGLTADGVRISSPAKSLVQADIPLNECGALSFQPAVSKLEEGTCRVFLTQGSLVSGKLLSLSDETLVLSSPVFGDISIPRSRVQGVALDPNLDRLIGASYKIDRIRMRNNQFVDGHIQSFADGKFKIDATNAREVEIEDAAGLLFRRSARVNNDPTLYARIDLVNGDRILGHLAASSALELGVVAPSLGAAVIAMEDVSRIEMSVSGGAMWGFTLIADYSDNRLIEVDERGQEIFVMEEILGAWDVECLDSGNLLVTEFSVSRVQEVTRSGKVVWSFEDLRNPYDADRLPNGNTLIADTFRGRVIEVTTAGEVVWKYDLGIRPFDVDRLPSGNTLIADVLKDRVIEVTREGEIVWEKKSLPNVHDADRLPNGNTLITLRTLNKVVEIDRGGTVVFEIKNLNSPSDADRLPNGHTLVAENGMVREFDRKGAVVWEREMTWAVEVNRY